MKMLYYGPLFWGSTALQRLEGLQKLVDHIYAVDSRMVLGEYLFRSPWMRAQIRLGKGPAVNKVSSLLLMESSRYNPDILWVDSGWCLKGETLNEIKRRTSAITVHYTPDPLKKGMAFNTKQFRELLPQFDLCITNKPDEIELYLSRGARNVHFCLQGYDPCLHRPIALDAADKKEYGCDVVFVGEPQVARCESLCKVLDNVDCSLHLHGRNWDKKVGGDRLGPHQIGWVHGDEYAKAICGAKISLAFLSQHAGDVYSTRTFEIPACGGFMLAQRTDMHQQLFEEDREAVFFDGDEELIEKVKYYLAHDELRERIAQAGRHRVIESGYAWEGGMKECLNKAVSLFSTFPPLSK